MTQQLAQIALLVDDYDRAIDYYVGVLGFELIEDSLLGEDGKRWVRVAPEGGGSGLLLAQAKTPEQRASVGDQCGGRVFLFLHTDDFQNDYAAYHAAGVRFEESPRHEPYGDVAVFRDIYGNRWDLVGPKSS